jgi:Ca2+-binding EF-hand superfamily protein
MFDVDNDGSITKDELITVLGGSAGEISDDLFKNMMSEADADGDEIISFEEFKSIV